MVDKVIVSNSQALQAKYGTKGLAAVKTAVKALLAADKARGLTARFIPIDNVAEMTKVGGRPPINARDQRGAKKAVDAIASKLAPDYIVLLDGPDVIPHIVLDNPVPNDDDYTVDSDLPYASSSGYAKEVARYLKVTRVVGRIPNVPGATDPTRIIDFLSTSAKANPVPATRYKNYFGLSAEVWEQSTKMSVDAAFGDNASVCIAPPSAPPGTDGELAKLSHFINCHGASLSPEFFGQRDRNYPVAMSSKQVSTKAVPGTVIAAECCYGGQLYDPILAGVDDPICIAYLAKGALGFVGSTNIAYGPAVSNAQADLLTQFFFERVLAGASLGRALLQARQRFITTQKMTNPINLKTLAQFVLLGDPSRQPCVIPSAVSPSKGLADLSDPEDAAAQRKFRRITLAAIGEAIPEGKAVPKGPGKASNEVKGRLRVIAEERGYRDWKEAVIAVKLPTVPGAGGKGMSSRESVIVFSQSSEAPSHISALRHLVAHVIGNGIVSLEEAVSR